MKILAALYGFLIIPVVISVIFVPIGLAEKYGDPTVETGSSLAAGLFFFIAAVCAAIAIFDS